MEQNYTQRSGSILFFGIVFLLVLFLIKFFNISYPVSVTNRTVSGELSVVGEGKVDIVPDTAEVAAGIVVQDAKTVQEVEQKINEVNNKIIASMTSLGIPKENIKTSSYSINPNYNYGSFEVSTATSYTGNATLTIKVRETNKLPQVITAATASGANQVYNAGFSIDNPEKYREQARNEAIENAKMQGQKLASQLGIRLGKIVNIIESSPDSYPIPLYKEALGTGRGGATEPNIEPGTQTVTSTVTLYFERN